MKEKHKQYAIEKGIDSVSFEQAIPRDKMPAMLQESDVLIAQFDDLELYQYGISPNKLYEYMAASKPISSSMRKEGTFMDLARAVRNKTRPFHSPL